MREMKDSGIEWIGEIPENWKYVRLKYTVKQCTERSNDSMGYIGLEHIESGSGRKINKDDDLLPEGIAIKIQKNDVLFGKLRPYLSKSYLVQQNGCCSTEFVVMRPIDIDSRFLKYITLTSTFVDSINISTYGAKMPRANWDYIGNIFVPLPNMGLQIHIADYLDRKCGQIDAIITRQREVIEKLKAYKLSVITEAVTKGLNPNVPMKDSGVEWIGEVPEHWDILKLQAHTRMLTPMRDRPEKLDGDIPWVRIEDYDGKYISASKEGLGVSTETVKEMNLKIYPVGSILCTSSCDLGKCAIVTRELVSNQRFINIIPDSNTNSDYLYYLMLSNAERLNHLSTGTIQANLSRKAFEHLMVQFPPISEQKAIAEYLDRKCEAVELSINKKQELIDRLSSYKKSLIYEVVTGKKEV